MIIYIFVFLFKTEIPTQIGKMSAAVFPKNFHLEHHYRPQGPDVSRIVEW